MVEISGALQGLLWALGQDPLHAGWETVAAIATSLSGLISLIAILGLWVQLTVSRKITQEATSNAIWAEYLKLAMHHPELAAPDYDRIVAAGEHEKYEWFISVLLFSAENLLQSGPHGRNWNDIILNNLRYHYAYLKSDYFEAENQILRSVKLKSLILKALYLGPL